MHPRLTSSKKGQKTDKALENAAQIAISKQRYRFGRFVLDPAERRVSNGDSLLSLTPKEFDLLTLLVENQGKLLTKNELLDKIWEGAESYESTLKTNISTLRQKLGDETQPYRFIQTVTKKGYRFIHPVEIDSDHPTLNRKPTVRRRWIFSIVSAAAILAITIGVIRWDRERQTYEALYRDSTNLERQGNDALALQKLNEALALRPGFDAGNLRAAWLLYDDNDNDSAFVYVRRVLAHKERLPMPLRLRAEAIELLLEGNEDDAFHKLQLSADADSSDTETLYALSEVAVDLGLYDQADQALRRCQAVDKTNPFCAFEIIALRVYQDRFADALLEYQRATATGSRYPWLHYPVGFARLASEDLDGALNDFRALEESGRKFASNVQFRTSQEGIAAVALYRGELQYARQQILNALTTSKAPYDKASYYAVLAGMDALHGQASDAIKEANLAIQLSRAPDIAILAARALAMASAYDAASDVLKKNADTSAQLGRRYPAAERLVAGLRAMSRSQWDAAIAAFADSYQLEPDPETAYYLAEAEMSDARWQDAAATLNRLLKSKGKILMDSFASLIPLAEYDLATCHEKLGDRSKAESLFQTVRKLWEHADPELQAGLRDTN